MPTGLDWIYDINHFIKQSPIKTILDVGANIGLVSKNLHNSFPVSNIYSIEPDPTAYSKLKQSTTSPKIKTFNIALGSQSEKLFVNFHPASQRNSIHISNQSDQLKSTEIQVENTAEFIKRQQIEIVDILKTDTEGYDLEVIKGAELLLKHNKIKFILSEIGFTKHDPQHTNISELIHYLDHFNYRLFQIYDFSDTNHFLEWGPSYANALFVNVSAFQDT